LPLASSSSDAVEQTCVVDSGSHPKRTREGATAAAFPIVEFYNSVRKKKEVETRFGVASSFEVAVVDCRSIVAVEYEYEYEYSSVADLQRDHRAINCLALTDGEISICCFVASLHPQFLGQLLQINILCPFSPAV
jgi:hypothetical protein